MSELSALTPEQDPSVQLYNEEIRLPDVERRVYALCRDLAISDQNDKLRHLPAVVALQTEIGEGCVCAGALLDRFTQVSDKKKLSRAKSLLAGYVELDVLSRVMHERILAPETTLVDG